MSGVIQLTLERDGHDQPWGFRLQGGHDVGLPLTVQRILVGTPAEGVLRKGDILCKVSYTDAKGLNHQQAADLFTNAGNQIQIFIRRPGVQGTPMPAPEPPRQVPGGVAMPGMATSSPASSPAPEPYRTSPLIQPSAKIVAEIGPGSTSHLKMQADYITGAKEAQPSPDAQNAKATEFVMKQKVTGTLQQIQNQPNNGSSPIPIAVPQPSYSPVSGSPQQFPMNPKPVKQFYNNPINLYSSDNVQEVAKLNNQGISGSVLGGVRSHANPGSPTGLINPVNIPNKNFFGKGGLPFKYDPEQSATWQAIREQEDCKLITEHGPEDSKLFSV